MPSFSQEAVIECNLTEVAARMRFDVIRMLRASHSGHPGGSLSCVDMIVALFFSGVMEYERGNPSDRSGDRFLLSKGHAAPALYSLYKQLGWLADDELNTLRRVTSRLQGHPDSKFLPAVEVCSGSLGQGLAVGCGLALALKYDANKSGKEPRHVYVLCGDGEMQEGSNWEALALASHLKLDNYTMLLDLNGLQIDGTTDEVCSLGDIDARVRAFGWAVSHVNGHDFGELIRALKHSRILNGSPHAIICDTIKGKGVPYMENKVDWHGKAPTDEEAELAFAAIGLEYGLTSGGNTYYA